MTPLRTPRYRWLFYRRGSSVPDQYGDLSRTPVFVTSGLFAREKARKPAEIVDAAATVGEAQYVLIGAWVPRVQDLVTSGLFAWCPALDKVVEVLGSPMDPTGEQKELLIWVMDNVRIEVNTASLPMS